MYMSGSYNNTVHLLVVISYRWEIYWPIYDDKCHCWCDVQWNFGSGVLCQQKHLSHTRTNTHENAYFAHGNRLCVPLNEHAFVLVDIAAGDSDR